MAIRNLRHEFARHLGKLRNSTGDVGDAYHRWYYKTQVWMSTKWMGLPTYKSVSDMWNYQEILYSLQPSLVVEFGTFSGGSALFFATVMRQTGNPFKIVSVDVNSAQVAEKVKRDPDIELLTISSTDSSVASRIAALKTQYPGNVFAILDSDHTKPHVLAEMMLLRPLLNSGDYMVVEDSNINGHPVLPLWGAGPYEAIEEYFKQFPNDYSFDRERETKFGFTFAPNGFLIRN